MRKLIALLIYMVDCFSPKNDKQIAFSSFPDLSDNSYAMFLYLFHKEQDAKFIWLISDDSEIIRYKEYLNKELMHTGLDLKRVLFVKKNSLSGLYQYFRSKYVFFTHGLYPTFSLPKNHILINLWHGMPLKNIGKLDSEKTNVPYSSYLIATSEFFKVYMSKAFNHSKDTTLVSGQPRNDWLFIENDSLSKFGINHSNYSKIFLWTPTYRKSIKGDIRNDGDFSDGLPVINNNFNELNDVLEEINAFMIIKLHPMDSLIINKYERYSKIIFLKNIDLEEKQCQLYSLLGEVDILLTDFSSIYIDYLLLNRPLGFITNDFNNYKKSRGFIVDKPKEYMPGTFISSESELFEFLKECVENIDRHEDEREQVNSILNIKNEKSAEQLWLMLQSNSIKT